MLSSMVPSRGITLLPTGIEDPHGRKLASSCWILNLEVMMGYDIRYVFEVEPSFRTV